MIIVEKSEGAKIPYEVAGTKVCFDDDLTINLAKRQEDWPVHIDVCSDKDGALVIGAESGRYYVAQIDVPAIEYEEVEATAEAENTDGEQAEGQQTETIRTAKPLNMDNVTLTLWALENYTITGDIENE